MDLRPHIDRCARRFAEVEAALSDPKVFDNNQRAQELSREYARLKELVAAGNAYLKAEADLGEAPRKLFYIRDQVHAGFERRQCRGFLNLKSEIRNPKQIRI